MSDDGFPTDLELKDKPVLKEITIETGHPEITIDNLTGKIQDMGYDVSSYGSHITDDDIAEGVKDFREKLDADRSEEFYKDNSEDFKKYSTYGFVASSLSTLLTLGLLIFQGIFSWILLVITILLWVASIVLLKLSKPEILYDTIWIKVSGKVYSGTKAREVRDSGKQKAGMTKTASSVYVHSEVKLLIGADSEIGVERVKSDVATISKYLQKI